MTKPKPATYGQLDRVLLGLGFSSERAEGHLRVYRHADSNTVIVFADQASDAPARDVDLISLRKHLVEKGLIDYRTLSHLLESTTTSAQ